MESSKNDPPASAPARARRSRTGSVSVYVGVDRFASVGKAALKVSNQLATGQVITVGELTQFLVDNYLELAWVAYARRLSMDLSVDAPVRIRKTGRSNVYVGVDRFASIGKAALNVSNHLNTGRIITAGEMAQYLIDNYLEMASEAYTRFLAHETTRLSQRIR